MSLSDIGWNDEIVEDGKTIEENAWIKAETVYKVKFTAVMAEDTGLQVDGLGGAPGVHTARFAGSTRTATDNMDKLLSMLGGETNRAARFKTVIALILDDHRHEFTGICEGRIGFEKKGTKGFGYDPIFVPENYSESFGQLRNSVKDQISHRAQAINKLMDFLLKYYNYETIVM